MLSSYFAPFPSPPIIPAIPFLHTVTLPSCHALTLLSCHAAKLPRCQAATLPCCLTTKPTCCLTSPLANLQIGSPANLQVRNPPSCSSVVQLILSSWNPAISPPSIWHPTTVLPPCNLPSCKSVNLEPYHDAIKSSHTLSRESYVCYPTSGSLSVCH